MSEEPPKLFTNKPKKPKRSVPASVSATTSSSGAAAPPPPPPPTTHRVPQPPLKEPFIKRYRFLWPLLLVVNFGIGGYVLLRTTMNDRKSKAEKESTKIEASSASASTPAPDVPTAAPVVATTVLEPRVQAWIDEDDQRELFKWMLEEKRKVKPRDSDEKTRIDEEKAILKQFIRAKSIPNI